MQFTGVLVSWPFAGDRDQPLALGDLHELDPILGHAGSAEQALAGLAEACRARGMRLYLDLVIDRAVAGSPVAAALPGCWRQAEAAWIDPRSIGESSSVLADFGQPGARASLVSFWQARLISWLDAGVAGVRCHDAAAVPLAAWEEILAPVRAADGAWIAIGWMTGRSRAELVRAAATFDFVTSSVFQWDGSAPGVVEEYAQVRPHGRMLAFPDDPLERRLAARIGRQPALAAHRLKLQAAALLADGWLMPMGFEYGARQDFFATPPVTADDFAATVAEAPFDLSAEIAAVNERLAHLDAAGRGTMRLMSGVGAAATVIHRGMQGVHGVLVALNASLDHQVVAKVEGVAARLGMALADDRSALELSPGEADVVELRPARPVAAEPLARAREIAAGPRIAIEAIWPALDDGRFAAKRIVGDLVTVEADIFADGHEVLGAELRWRSIDEPDWSRVRMTHRVNDRWEGSFTVLRPGRHLFSVEAWWDHFGTFQRDLMKKRDAGLDLTLEIAEGRLLLQQFLATASDSARTVIERGLRELDEAGADGARLLMAEELRVAMEEADHRPFATGGDRTIPLDVDREAAAFASWYELFPRSITDSATRHGTFLDVIGRLPAIREMGFDVLYFPPIHPIGRTNRKGRNNTLTPAAEDPGSPYAIGSSDGGHDALHPELGSREDFRELVRAAARHGLEIAIDFAIQCSPDHPWLKEHPDWFAWRPDGSMKYAENPPKKYQDIVNVDFYADGAMPDLWLALRDVVQGWVDEGVRTFRVDNPHTKPFPFWEWLIADIRSRDPGVIFLAEAFTRPKVMYMLGKVGFAQSYTYFTWRNEKAELTEYLTELNARPVRDLYRPHFFVNTPDINPVFLQTSGRQGFLIRAALAATLSGLWGVYSGFELCEAAAIPGREEYLDSEKYEIRPRDWRAPGNIIAEITRLNEIRKSHPALQTHLGLTFYHASNDRVLYYGKRSAGDRSMVLIAVSLDPHGPQSSALEIPLWEFGLPDDGSVTVENLMHGDRFTWTGKWQQVQFDPTALPFSIWSVVPVGDAR